MRKVSHVYIRPEALSGARAALGLSQKELARLADLGLSTIANSERGRKARVSRVTAGLLCEALGQDFDALFYRVSNLDTTKEERGTNL